MKILEFLAKTFIPSAKNNYLPAILSKRFLNFIFILLLILKLFTIPLIFSISRSLFFAEIAKVAILEYLNKERQERKLPPLVESPLLSQSAYLKAKDILEKDYFAHRSPDGLSPWYWFKIAGYEFKLAGENLAIGFLDSKEVHDALMASFSHRQNILNPEFKEIGIAVLKGDFNGNEVYVVVQHFGVPKEKPVVFQPEKPISQPPPSPKTTPISTPTPPLTTQPTQEVSQILPETQTITEISTPTETAQATSQTTSIQTPTKTQPPQKLEEKKVQKLAFNFLKFFSTKYHSLLDGIIYFILASLIFTITLVIYFDIFLYRKLAIAYRELAPRWLGLVLLLIVFLYLDQTKMVQLIPHELMIYGN